MLFSGFQQRCPHQNPCQALSAKLLWNEGVLKNHAVSSGDVAQESNLALDGGLKALPGNIMLDLRFGCLRIHKPVAVVLTFYPSA